MCKYTGTSTPGQPSSGRASEDSFLTFPFLSGRSLIGSGQISSNRHSELTEANGRLGPTISLTAALGEVVALALQARTPELVLYQQTLGCLPIARALVY